MTRTALGTQMHPKTGMFWEFIFIRIKQKLLLNKFWTRHFWYKINIFSNYIAINLPQIDVGTPVLSGGTGNRGPTTLIRPAKRRVRTRAVIIRAAVPSFWRCLSPAMASRFFFKFKFKRGVGA